jgi:glutathione S-transferase
VITLYSGSVSMFGAKAEIALREKQITFELILVPFSIEHHYEPKHPEVLRINPFKAQVPVLKNGDVEIYDSTQIFEYAESLCTGPSLWPVDVARKAHARQLELQSDEVFFPHVIQRMKSRVTSEDHALAKRSKAALLDYYAIIDTLLVQREYLAGTFSYADIAFFMAQHFSAMWGAPPPTQLSNLIHWRDRIGKRRIVADVVIRIDRFVKTASSPNSDAQA